MRYDLTEVEGQFTSSQEEGRTDSPWARHSGSADPDPGDMAATPKSEGCPSPKSPGEAAPAAEGSPRGVARAAVQATCAGGINRPEALSALASPEEGTPTPEGHTPGREATPEDSLDCDPTWESVRQDVSRLCQLAAEPYLLSLGFQEYPPHQGLALPATMALRWCGVAAMLGSLVPVLGIWAAGLGQPREEGGGERVPLEPLDPSTCLPDWERGPPAYSRPSYAAEIYEVAASGYWDHILVAMAVGLMAGLVAHWIYATRQKMQYGPIHRSVRPPPNPISDGAGPTGGPDPRTGWERKPEYRWGSPPGPQGPTQEWNMGPQGGSHSFPHPGRGLEDQGPPTLYPGLPSG